MEARGNKTYEEFLKEILRPTNLSSLKDHVASASALASEAEAEAEASSINILVFTNPNSSEPTREIVIDNLYPFQTVADLCTRIYIESGERDEYHPENQCLLKQK